MNTYSRFAAAILVINFSLITTLSFAADEDKPAKPPKIFDESSEMKVVFSGPWKRIGKNAKKDIKYPVQLTYTGADGNQHTIDVQVAPRGITRRRICDFPPLKIHFDKEKMKGTEFRGNKSLKLVTYCDTNSKYQQYYVKEFLIYRIYNMLTEYSFRVRPMMIDYKDSEKGGAPVTRFSFLIEDIDDVAERNDFEELSIATTPYRDLEPAVTSNMSLFQYMIGNVDWSATGGPKKDSCCHNFRLIGAGNEVKPKFGVPYDFDSNGLVNAHYSAPPEVLKLRNIRQRMYRGFCAYNDQLPQSAELLNEKKADILALFKNNSLLDDRSRKNAIAYIEDFYEILNNPKKFKKSVTDKCRGRK